MSEEPAEHKRNIEQRLRELEPTSDDNIGLQHVISKVILRRFTRESPQAGKQLCRLDLNYPERHTRMTGPNACGRVMNFVKYSSRSAEMFWGSIEENFPKALSAIDDHTILEKPDLTSIAKDILSVHLSRSKVSTTIHTEGYVAISQASREMLRGQIELLRAWKEKKCGLILTGSDWVDEVIDELHANVKRNYDRGAYFRLQPERVYGNIREYIETRGIEILYSSAASDFLIGDIPAVPFDAATNRVGIIGGVRVDAATHIVMPVGRHACISVKDGTNTAREVTDDEVREINTLQLRAAQDEVYFHPESELDKWVRSNFSQLRGL